jgi:AcrR family transcriptional regulator
MTETLNTNLRRAILDAARHFLVTEGYKSLSMRKIAQEVGCSPGTIYLYFKNKDAIFHALMDEGYEQLYQAYQAVLATEADPYRQLEGICWAFVDFGLRHTEYYEIMYLQHPRQIARFPKEQYRRARRILDVTAAVFSDCVEVGLLHSTDPFTAATLLWSAMHGIVSLIVTQRVDARFEPEDLIAQAIQHTLNGFRLPEGELDEVTST